MSTICANEYLDLLIDSLTFITRHPTVCGKREFADYLLEIGEVLGKLRSVKATGHSKWTANFKIVIPLDEYEMCGPDGETFLFLGAKIEVGDEDKISQSIGAWLIYKPFDPVLESNVNDIYPINNDEYTVCRKFHFDYDMDLESNEDCHWPWAHMQYGGDCNKELLPYDQDKINYHLFSALDFPRIPFPPYDFNLAFHLFCRQFENPLSDFIQEPGWRKVVKKSESVVLKK